jgi:1-acyl-sn-glycerol-3-phosphate acyltransferase
MNRFLGWFCKIFLKPIVDLFLIKEVKGIENIPKRNFILVANHQSHLDQICTGYVALAKYIHSFHMIGQVDRYNDKFLTKFLRDFFYFVGGVIPIDRRSSDSRKKALEEAIKVLKKGEVLIIYPEGTRTRLGEGKMGEAKSGVGKLHLLTGVPILPVAIKGTFELMPPGRAFPKIKKIIKMNVGKPIFFQKEIELAKNLDCEKEEFKNLSQKIAQKVMEEIKSLYQKI